MTDNGCGVTPQCLEYICKSGYTSKLRTSLNGLNCSYGFRGQSLSSIGSQSVIVITSRHMDYCCTKSVRVNFGERSQVYFTSEPMASPGTTVICNDLFNNFPVRQKQMLLISESIHVEQLKLALLQIAVAHPNVTLAIHNTNQQRLFYISDFSGESKLSRNIELLRAIHGSAIAKTWDCISARSRNSSARAVISHDPAISKTSQYISMPIVRSRLSF